MKNIISVFTIVLFLVNNAFGQENGIYTDLATALKEPLKVKTLELTYMKLSSFPTEIFKMKNLERLSLEGNKLITTLPKEIGNLTNLKELILYGLPLTELPKEIGNLTNLEKLNLTDANLNSLPQEMKKLKKLEQLWIQNAFSYEFRKNFPYDIIEELTSLKLLDLNGLYLSVAELEKIQSLLPEGGSIYCYTCPKFNENVPRKKKDSDDINLDDLDLSLDDKPKDKPKEKPQTSIKDKILQDGAVLYFKGNTCYKYENKFYDKSFTEIGNVSGGTYRFGGVEMYKESNNVVSKGSKIIAYTDMSSSFFEASKKTLYLKMNVNENTIYKGNAKFIEYKRSSKVASNIYIKDVVVLADYFGL